MRSAAGNQQLFAELFRAHSGFVWRVLSRLGVHDAEREDALQEVFMVVATKLDNYDERGAVRAWLFTIARQVASHFRRSRLRVAARIATMVRPEQTSPSPHERLEAAELVQGFLAKLDPAQAMVFYLADVEGMTAPEIGLALELNLTTVHGRLRLARKHFESVTRVHRSAAPVTEAKEQKGERDG